MRMHRVKNVFLGESLSALAHILKSKMESNSLIVDIWDGGSIYQGWDIGKICLDRVPLFLKEKCLRNTEYLQYTPDVTYIGEEMEYLHKVSGGLDVQRNWLHEYSHGGFLPKSMWCSWFRELKKGIKVPKIYGNIVKIVPENGLIEAAGRKETIYYNRLYNTLPLPYFLRKIQSSYKFYEVASEVPYISLVILLIVLKIKDIERVIFVGKRKYFVNTIVTLDASKIYEGLEGYMLVYSFASVSTKNKLRPGLWEKMLSDLKKLGIIKGDIISSRYYIEKYALLGRWDKLGEVKNKLSGVGVTLMGRLGLWFDIGLDKIIKQLPQLPRGNPHQ
jgi:hypothetical protein